MKLSLHKLPTTSYLNRLSSPNCQLRTEPVLSVAEGNNELLTSIKNPTLAHFRHFSSLFTNLPSTTVKNPLQISPFLTNKANFRKSQVYVSPVITAEYENETLGQSGKNEPKTNPIRTQTNPIKANLQKDQMNVSVIITKDYEKMSNWALFENEPNSNPNKPNFKGKKMLLHLTINGLRKRVLIFYVKSGFYSDAPELAFCLRNTIPVLSTFILSEIEVVEGYEIC